MAVKELFKQQEKDTLTEEEKAKLADLKKQLLNLQEKHDKEQNLWANVIGATKNLSGTFKTGDSQVKRLRVSKD